jgi:hypothetical protein
MAKLTVQIVIAIFVVACNNHTHQADSSTTDTSPRYKPFAMMYHVDSDSLRLARSMDSLRHTLYPLDTFRTLLDSFLATIFDSTQRNHWTYGYFFSQVS